MDCELVFTANAGCILHWGRFCILLDALHSEQTDEFSSLNEAQIQEVFSLLDKRPPQLILVTHRHPDHYSPQLVEQALGRYPGALLVRPSREGRMGSKRLTLEWFPLPHRGGGAANFGFLLSLDGKRIFTAGDADPGAAETLQRCAGLQPDLALLNFPWLSLRSGRQALEQLGCRQLCLFHLPYAAEDALGYLATTRRLAEPLGARVRVLSEFLQTERFSL